MVLAVLEVFIISIRFLFLFYGAFITFFLGESLYRYLNQLFYAHSVPCLEMISFIVALVAPIAFMYGVRHNKVFFKRTRQYNFLLFVLSYIFGMLIAFLPMINTIVGSEICAQQTTLAAKIAHGISTGAITSLMAYLNFDLGVFYARFIMNKLRKHKQLQKKKHTGKKK